VRLVENPREALADRDIAKTSRMDHAVRPLRRLVVTERRRLAYSTFIGSFVVVLGHRDSAGIWGNFLGGVADRVINLVHCDVLIERRRT
jgi:nucleotide-binding universal stress UspA family protein